MYVIAWISYLLNQSNVLVLMVPGKRCLASDLHKIRIL